MLSTRKLILLISIYIFFILAFLFFSIVLTKGIFNLCSRSKTQLSGLSIQEINKTIFSTPNSVRKQTLDVVKVFNWNKNDAAIAILGLTSKSRIIMRSPEQDWLARRYLSVDYPVYTAYESLSMHVIVMIGSIIFLCILIEGLGFHVIGIIKEIRRRGDDAKAGHDWDRP